MFERWTFLPLTSLPKGEASLGQASGSVWSDTRAQPLSSRHRGCC